MDEIIQEIWKTKDAIAEENHYDIDLLVQRLQLEEQNNTFSVVDLRDNNVQSEVQAKEKV